MAASFVGNVKSGIDVVVERCISFVGGVKVQ